MKATDKNFRTSQFEILDDVLMQAIQGGKTSSADLSIGEEDLPPAP